MKNGILAILVSFLLFMNGSCIKDDVCNDKSIDSERSTITSYATANSINATAHSSGVYYEIMTAGSGATPNSNSNVTVKYIGKRLDGTIFDDKSTTPVTFRLGDVILGWQSGLPQIQKGGRIKLIIPSSLGYGCKGFGAVPSNTILFFDIELVDVQ